MPVVRKAAVCLVLATVAAFLPTTLDAASAAIVPPQNPSANISPAPGYFGPCGSVASPNLYCPSGLTTIYGDRQVEGVSPMSLPSTWTSLTPPEQLFVLTDLERVDRGLPPIAGLAANLNAYAHARAPPGRPPARRAPRAPRRTGARAPPPTPRRDRWARPWPRGCTKTAPG